MRPVPLLALSAAIWAASSLAASALDKGNGGDPKPAPTASGEGLAFPGGGWSKVCGGASVTRQFEMTATCSAPDAPPTTSTLKLTECAQPAVVDAKDGKLVCGNGPRAAPAGGSWTASCIGEVLKGTVLTASCLAADGKAVAATIDMSTCASPPELVANDGKLACATLAAAPVAAAAPAGPTDGSGKADDAYAGSWNIKTERGDALHLTIEQDGSKAAGSVAFRKDTLTFTGHVDEEGRLQLVWTLGKLTGLGTLALLDGGKQLNGKIVLADGGAVAGGTWDSERASAAPAAALPLGETGAKTEGFAAAAVTGTVVVRDGPTTKGTKILATLQKGDKVSVKCAANGWCELAEGGRYVARSFLSLGGEKPKAAATPAKPAKKVVVVKKQQPKKKEAVQHENPPTIFGVPGLIITFGHKGQQN